MTRTEPAEQVEQTERIERIERIERAYAQAERPLIALNERRVRRGPELLIGVLVGLALAVGVVVVVDLRRLNTPGGAALAWTGAALFGNCTAYEKLSIPAPQTGTPQTGTPQTGTPDLRSPAQQCRDLQQRTAPNRAASSGLRIDLLSVQATGAATGEAAVVRLRLTREATVLVVPLTLERRGAGWVVQRSAATCRAVGCR